MSAELERAWSPSHQDEAAGEDASAGQALARLEALVAQAREAAGAERVELAGPVNDALVSLRQARNRSVAVALLRKLLAGNALDGLSDRWARSCRQEAVRTLLGYGFPWALEVTPEDLQAERATEWLAARWPVALEEQLQLRTRGGLGVLAVVSLAVMIALFDPEDGTSMAGTHAGLSAIVALRRLFAGSPKKVHPVDRYGPAARRALAFQGFLFVLWGSAAVWLRGPLGLPVTLAWLLLLGLRSPLFARKESGTPT